MTDEEKTQARDALIAERLLIIRDRLFRLKGYLEATGYPHVALTWVEEALEIVTFLQTMEV